MSQAVKGVVVGLVSDLDDPEGLGRIRVELPWLGDDSVSTWARVARMLAGPGLGTFFQPEIGDEALLAFEMDDIRRPYIVGFLWNADSTPPGDDPNLRLIQTVSGHKLTFDDTSGGEQISIEDASGNKIVMSSDGISIESARDVTIKGINVTIEASAVLKATGSPIHLNP